MLPHGEMSRGIFRVLDREHATLRVLLKRLSESDDARDRANFFPELRRRLLAHQRAKRTQLYPLLHEFIETRTLAERHDVEALEIEQLVEQLASTSYRSPAWPSLVERLVRLTARHMREEEAWRLPKAAEVLGLDRAEQLERPYLAAKKMFIEQMR